MPDIAIFALALATLLWGANLFTGAAERIGLRLGLSPFLVGVLIVSTGTSLPELISSLIAASRGTTEIVAGNVLGANISNLLMVLGVAAIASGREIRLGDQYIFIDLHYVVGSAFLVSIAAFSGSVGRLEGLLLLACYLVYVFYLIRAPSSDTVAAEHAGIPGKPLKDAAIIVIGAALIWLGAAKTIDSLGAIATAMGIAPGVVAVLLLSVGTTLPELVVSAGLARRGRGDVAVGNVLGSCIFNGLAVMGSAALIHPVAVPDSLRALVLPCFAGAALLFYLLTQDKRISNWEGGLLLAIYALFVLNVAGLV